MTTISIEQFRAEYDGSVTVSNDKGHTVDLIAVAPPPAGDLVRVFVDVDLAGSDVREQVRYAPDDTYVRLEFGLTREAARDLAHALLRARIEDLAAVGGAAS